MSWFLSNSKGFLPEKGTFTLNFATMSDQLDNLYMKSFFFTFYLFCGVVAADLVHSKISADWGSLFFSYQNSLSILLASVTLIGRDNNKVIKEEEHCNTMFSETRKQFQKQYKITSNSIFLII